ncbi:MAG: hypothetical protein AAF591_19345 [Verrucomicrobiota bacterium]
MTRDSNIAALALAMEDMFARMANAHRRSDKGPRPLGLPDWDRELWRLARGCLPPVAAEAPTHGPDLYLATQIYKGGGHTGLIGDFVQALDPGANNSHLIVSNLYNENKSPLDEKISSRTRIHPSNTYLLEGPHIGDRLQQLMTRVQSLRPGRVFLFHHPGDPLPAAVAHPEWTSQCVLVHHADATPSFGLYFPGVQPIELHPFGAAATRILGLAPEILMLSAPDPGPRSGNFLASGTLTTASCGSTLKFESPYHYSYPETIAVLLAHTGGKHVHIGPLTDNLLKSIATHLHHHQVQEDRFHHVPWVPSLSQALWDHDCDLYFSSFPIDGARVNAEVAAAAVPHLRHARSMPLKGMQSDPLGLKGGLAWHTWSDLKNQLTKAANADFLIRRSTEIRETYDALHHPRVFTKTLTDILAGKTGIADPIADNRENRALRSTLQRLEIAGLFPDKSPELASGAEDA